MINRKSVARSVLNIACGCLGVGERALGPVRVISLQRQPVLALGYLKGSSLHEHFKLLDSTTAVPLNLERGHGTPGGLAGANRVSVQPPFF